jgi:hypothetical protein
MYGIKTMQKSKLYLWAISNHWIGDSLPAFSLLVIAITIFAINAFPALYGDEYGSLFESHHLTVNIHAIGYLSQLYFWSSIFGSDWFLRILSVLWFGVGLYWLNAWLKDEQISSPARTFVIWLALLNPFLWFYGFQIRFYAMFLTASILFVWRFRVWEKSSSFRHAIFLAISGLLLVTSHLFGALVLATAFLHYLWTRFAGKRWIFLSILALGSVTILLPPVRLVLISIVYRMSNPYADISTLSERGISVGMLAKIPLAFYFFTLGERVYPLWWWVTIPAIIVVGLAFALGLWHLRRLAGLGSLTVLMLLNIPLLFLVLDPLAPPGLQGAAPRYVIFVVPYFLLLLALGAQVWKPLKPALILVSVAGLYFLAMSVWSYSGSDLMDWPLYLREAVPYSQQTCIITDGRAQDAVIRYAPVGTKVALMGKAADCSGFSRVVLVSDDFRLLQVRYFDQMGENVSKDYAPVSNVTLFPAQITVYEKKPALQLQFVPSRLDLPEQDLHFPIPIPKYGWQVDGFARLDDKVPAVTIPLKLENAGSLWVLTNYYMETLPTSGTPVFKLHFSGIPGSDDVEMTLRAGEETTDWEGHCNSCISVYEWTKLLHLLGSYAYSGAYRQYQAHVWGFPFNLAVQKFETVTITYLLQNGTGYFWGMYSGSR